MTLATEDHLDDLVQMREQGLRCVEAARGKGDDFALMTWQTCLSRIEAMIKRRGSQDIA